MATTTFLQLCQDTASEAGVNGADGTLPSTVVGQTGELRRIVSWMQKVWLKVQGERFYDWMWELATITIPVGQNYVAQSIAEGRYIHDSAFQPVASSDGKWMSYVRWSDWRQTYDDVYIAGQNSATAWTIRPDQAIVVNATPTVASGVFVFYVERYQNPTKLVNDGDTPGLPEDLVDILVQMALIRYANYDEAGAMRSTADAEVAALQRKINDRCQPTLSIGGTLLDY